MAAEFYHGHGPRTCILRSTPTCLRPKFDMPTATSKHFGGIPTINTALSPAFTDSGRFTRKQEVGLFRVK